MVLEQLIVPLLKIQQVPTAYVNQVWPQVEGFIDSALHFAHGEYTVDEARVYTIMGQWSLVIGIDDQDKIHGALLVSYFDRPRERVAFVVAIGGKYVSSKENWAQFEAIIKSNGATHLEGAARESIVRLWSRYGMEPKYTIVGKEL